jgi:hypothetical protein
MTLARCLARRRDDLHTTERPAMPALRKRNNRRASLIRVDIKCKRDTLLISG